MLPRPLYLRKSFWQGTFVAFLGVALVWFVTAESSSKSGKNQKELKKQEILATDISSKVVIIGNLGAPVGETVTITGRKVNAGRTPTFFKVTSLNDRPIEPRILEVPGIENWPLDTEAELQGAEVGTLKFLTLSDTSFAWGGDSRWKGAHQELFLEFRVGTVISPANLKLEPRKGR